MNSLVAPLPNICAIEFNSTCSLDCLFCPVHYKAIPRYGTLMTDEIFCRIVEEIRPTVKYIYIGGYGEFLLHPHFAEYVHTLKQFAKLNLATNLTVLSDENLKALDLIDDLSVSISATDRESYLKIHGKDFFQTVQENLKRLQRDFNITNIESAISHGTKPLALPLRKEMRSLWTPVNSRFDNVDGELVLKSDIGKCREMWRVVYFLSDGTVTFCCYDHAGVGNLGNIRTQSLEEIWNGGPYQTLRENHLQGQFHPVCLNQCSRP